MTNDGPALTGDSFVGCHWRGMTKTLAEAAPNGSTILIYSRLSAEDSLLDARTALVKQLHFDGWFLGNWLREKNFLRALRLFGQAQSLLATDLRSLVHKRIPLSAAKQGLEMYTGDMTAGKILLVANPQEVMLDS